MNFRLINNVVSFFDFLLSLSTFQLVAILKTGNKNKPTTTKSKTKNKLILYFFITCIFFVGDIKQLTQFLMYIIYVFLYYFCIISILFLHYFYIIFTLFLYHSYIMYALNSNKNVVFLNLIRVFLTLLLCYFSTQLFEP